MAEILYRPLPHECRAELAELGIQPVGSIAKCSCDNVFARIHDENEGVDWQIVTIRPAAPKV